jgi:hypothetical protein
VYVSALHGSVDLSAAHSRSWLDPVRDFCDRGSTGLLRSGCHDGPHRAQDHPDPRLCDDGTQFRRYVFMLPETKGKSLEELSAKDPGLELALAPSTP